MKPLKVVERPMELEALVWDPDQNGKQRGGGWPRTARWAAVRAAKVSAIDLSLYIQQMGRLPQVARKGEWILVNEYGVAAVVSQADFPRRYITADHVKVDP